LLGTRKLFATTSVTKKKFYKRLFLNWRNNVGENASEFALAPWAALPQIGLLSVLEH